MLVSSCCEVDFFLTTVIHLETCFEIEKNIRCSISLFKPTQPDSCTLISKSSKVLLSTPPPINLKMQTTLLLACALARLASVAAAGPATFINNNWAAGFVQGGEYNISWTSTDTGPISINLLSGNYSQPIFGKSPEALFENSSIPVSDVDIANDVAGSPYLWTVPAVAVGGYQLQLLDNGAASDLSPTFQITTVALPPALGGQNGTTATPTSAAPTTTAEPMTTVTVYDPECGCHSETVVPVASAYAYAAASASAHASAGGSGAEAEATAAASASASAEAGAGAAPVVAPAAAPAAAGPGSNYTAALITPTFAPYAAGNGAGRLGGSAGVAVALLAVVLVA